MTLVKRLVLLVTALVATMTLSVGTAAAHSVAMSSNPEDGAQIATAPEQVSVTFNEDLQEQFAALTVVGPDGNLWSKSDPVIEGPTISVEIDGLGPVGEYTIAYRVTSADGHPVSGTRTFTLTEEGTGTPGEPASGEAAADGEEGGGGVPVWIFVVLAVVVIAGGLAFALRKPKS